MRCIPEERLRTFKELYSLLSKTFDINQNKFFNWAEDCKLSFFKERISLLENFNAKQLEKIHVERRLPLDKNTVCEISEKGNDYEITFIFDLGDDYEHEVQKPVKMINAVFRWMAVQLSTKTKIHCINRIMTNSTTGKYCLYSSLTLNKRNSITAFNLNVCLISGLKMADLLFKPDVFILIENLYHNLVIGEKDLWAYSPTNKLLVPAYNANIVKAIKTVIDNNVTEIVEDVFDHDVDFSIVREPTTDGSIIISISLSSPISKNVDEVLNGHPIWDFVYMLMVSSQYDSSMLYFGNEMGKYEPMYKTGFSKDIFEMILRGTVHLHILVKNLHVLYIVEEILFNTYQHDKFSLKMMT